MAEDLDHLLTVHLLLHEALQLADGLLLADEVGGGFAADVLHGEGHAEHAHQHHSHQVHREPEHDAQQADQHDAGLQDAGQALADELAQSVDVVRVVGHDVAVAVGVEILDGQGLHLVEHALAHLVQEALGDDCHQPGVEVVQHDGDDQDDHHHDHHGQKLRLCARPVLCIHKAQDNRGDLLNEDGRGDVAQGIEGHKEHRQQEGPLVVLHEQLDDAGQGPLASLGHVFFVHLGIRHPPRLPSSERYRPRGRSRWKPEAPRGCPGRRRVRFPSQG